MHSEIASGVSKPWNEMVAALTAEAWLNPDFAKSLAEDRAAAIKDFAAENQIFLPDDEDFASFDLAESPIGDVSVPPNFSQYMGTVTLYCSATCPSAIGCVTQQCYTNGCSAGCPTNGCIPYTSDGCSAGC